MSSYDASTPRGRDNKKGEGAGASTEIPSTAGGREADRPPVVGHEKASRGEEKEPGEHGKSAAEQLKNNRLVVEAVKLQMLAAEGKLAVAEQTRRSMSGTGEEDVDAAAVEEKLKAVVAETDEIETLAEGRTEEDRPGRGSDGGAEAGGAAVGETQVRESRTA